MQPLPGGRDGLAVREVLHVAAGEDAGDVRVRVPGLRPDVAVVVKLELALEEVGVRRVADGDEEAGAR